MHALTSATDQQPVLIRRGSLRTRRDLLKDPVRTLVLVKARQAGMTLRDVSLRLNRAQGYMSVYLTKGFPAELSAEVRAVLAPLLDVAEEQLVQRTGAILALESLAARPASYVPTVPLYTDQERLTDPAQAKRLIARPLVTSTDVTGMVAVTITDMETDRVRSGDTVYLSPTTPHAGDLAAVITVTGYLDRIEEILTVEPIGLLGQYSIGWWFDEPGTQFVTPLGSSLRKVVAIIPK